MKKVIVLIVIFLSVAVVITGKLHWNNKIQATVESAQVKGNDKVNIAAEVETEDKVKVEEVEKYTKNLPEELQSKFVSAVQEGNPVRFIIAGSSTTANEPNTWATLLKEELENAYSKNLVKVTILEIADKTSTQVVQEKLYQEIIDLSPDILLFEPFILYDNGKVKLEDRLENLTQILTAIKMEKADISILLQPANPLFKARHYPNEVLELETYAEEITIFI